MSKTITLTDEQYQALKNGEDITIKPPKKVWEPEGGKFFMCGDLRVKNGISDYDFRISGMERKTELEAESAAVELRRYARLLAYRDQFAPGYVVPPIGDRAYYVLASDGGYGFCHDTHCRDLCVVYMPEDVAADLARKLNSGEVVL